MASTNVFDFIGNVINALTEDVNPSTNSSLRRYEDDDRPLCSYYAPRRRLARRSNVSIDMILRISYDHQIQSKMSYNFVRDILNEYGDVIIASERGARNNNVDADIANDIIVSARERGFDVDVYVRNGNKYFDVIDNRGNIDIRIRVVNNADRW